jgi:hypothetical protein
LSVHQGIYHLPSGNRDEVQGLYSIKVLLA